MLRTRLLVIQPTPFCNIDCTYCYLPGRNSKSVIDHTTLWNLFWQLFASGWVRDRLDVVWHAGEPMVLPIGFYRQALDLIERMRPRDLRVLHHVQTNGTLISDEWCEFFLRERIQVGVSVDGPRHINDRHRVSRAGRGTFDRTIAGIRLLRKNKVPFHVISVISRASMASARELFDFYVAEGIEHVAFNVEDSVNHHVSGVLSDPDSAAAYRDFLDEFWALASARDRIKSIREIDDMLHAIASPPRTGVRSEMAEPFTILNIDCSGNVSTFSPELLGVKNDQYQDFCLGNINRDWLVDFPNTPLLLRMLEEIEAGVAMCREQCPYFAVCGGGEPANKLTENGTFASAATSSCRLTRMAVADVVLGGISVL
jgi:uncharacterized protein